MSIKARDRVKVVRDASSAWVGREGTVVAVTNHPLWPYEVLMDENPQNYTEALLPGESPTSVWANDELEVVE